jgi:predicted MPP superfamily phosphohydrolase
VEVAIVIRGKRAVVWLHYYWKHRRIRPKTVNESRRNFLRRAGAISLVTASGLCGYGIVLQTITPGVNRKEIFYPNLPRELEGFVICHISDVHLGMWATQADFRNALTAARNEKPDLVLITGDLVDRDPNNSKQYYEPLALLREVPHGVYGVLGNHDHYTGAREVVNQLDGHGLKMLVENSINLPEAPITLVGLDDQHSGSWLSTYFRRWREGQDTDPDVFTFDRLTGPARRAGDFGILMNHRPEGYRQASNEGFDLFLAGHTHGGQYQFPLLTQVNLSGYFYRYSSGLYHEHDCWLNVSRGLASVGIPFRLFAWPEIDIITLKTLKKTASV